MLIVRTDGRRARCLLLFAKPAFELLDFRTQQVFGRPPLRLSIEREVNESAAEFGFSAALFRRNVGKQFRPSCFFGELFGAEQGWQVPGYAIQSRGARVTGSVLFRSLDLLPIRPNLVHIFDFDIAKYMRVAPDEFLRYVTRDVVEVERTTLFGELAMQDNLQ